MAKTISAEPLDYDEVAARLAPIRSWIRPAELHGLLCGSVCAGGGSGLDDAGWTARIREHAGDDLLAAAEIDELVWFRNRALVNLGDADLVFDLVLPDPEGPIEERLDELGAWCAGFLSGYGLAGGRSDDLEEDARSGLKDLAAISELTGDAAEDEASAEDDYAELVEYVRVLVLLILTQRLGRREQH